MTVHRHRTIEPPPSPSRTAADARGRAGRCPSAAFAAALAAGLLLGGAPAAGEPVFVPQGTIYAPVGVIVLKRLWEMFENPGTNPRLTDAEFSTTEYYDESLFTAEYVRLKPKGHAALRDLASPPTNPFFVDVTVTMENDEGETASGTVTFRTRYADMGRAPPPPPVLDSSKINAPPGTLVTLDAEDVFDNAGTNPRFTDAVFSTTEYYDTGRITALGYLKVKAKVAGKLNALASPPPNPFTVTATVTMANDEGQTATGTLTFETYYRRSE